MDYRDYQEGVDGQHFWFKGKIGLIDVLLSQSTASKKLKILNVGAGTGEDLAVIKKYGSIYAVDIDQQALDMIPLDLTVERKKADVCMLPYDDQSFDMVVAFDVMEHVENDQAMVNEIYRVLKPDGHFIFTVPAFNFLFSGHDRALHHFRRYNKTMIKSLMKSFLQITYGYWFFFLFLPAGASRLFNKNSSTSSMFKIPGILNNFFYILLRIENWFIVQGLRFPFGLTLYGIYKKR